MPYLLNYVKQIFTKLHLLFGLSQNVVKVNVIGVLVGKFEENDFEMGDVFC